jgi:hypothetical protein
MTSAQAFGLLALALLVLDVALWLRALRAPASTRRAQLVSASLFCVSAVVVLGIFFTRLSQEQSQQAVAAPGW